MLLAFAMQTAPAAPRTIEKGDQSNIEDAAQKVIQTDAEWAALWRRHSPDRPMPKVDFTREMVIGVFMGSRSNAGFSTEVISAVVVKGVLVAQYRETVPSRGAITAQILTFPYHLVAIPKAPVTETKFDGFPDKILENSKFRIPNSYFFFTRWSPWSSSPLVSSPTRSSRPAPSSGRRTT